MGSGGDIFAGDVEVELGEVGVLAGGDEGVEFGAGEGFGEFAVGEDDESGADGLEHFEDVAGEDDGASVVAVLLEAASDAVGGFGVEADKRFVE